MTTYQIALLVIGLIQTIALPWAVWVTRKIFLLDKELSLNAQNDLATQQALNKLNDNVEKLLAQNSKILIELAGKGIKVDKVA